LLSLLFFSKRLNGAWCRTYAHEDRWTWSEADLAWYRQLLRNTAAPDSSASFGGSKRFIGKPMCSTPQIRRWLAMFPDARVVLTCRHPWKVIRSLEGLFRQLDFFVQADLDTDLFTCQLERHYETLLSFLREPHPRVRVLRHEDLVASPEETVRSVMAWAELPVVDSIDADVRLETHVNSEADAAVATRLIRTNRGMWKRICDELGYQLDAHFGEGAGSVVSEMHHSASAGAGAVKASRSVQPRAREERGGNALGSRKPRGRRRRSKSP
jgi:hypothetical protein